MVKWYTADMRSVPLLKDNYYHVYNRGNQKQRLFHDYNDWIRFLFLILHLQSPSSFNNVHRQVKYFSKHKNFNVSEEETSKIINEREVSLINFCIMPNHFHMTLYSVNDGGISRYLHRVSTSYAKYYNTKYDKIGHVFEGRYKAKLIINDNYLTYLSAYIHKNPTEIVKWKGKEELYPWSSLTDYMNNRWGDLVMTNVILYKFKKVNDYLSFVKTSGAKDMEIITGINI